MLRRPLLWQLATRDVSQHGSVLPSFDEPCFFLRFRPFCWRRLPFFLFGRLPLWPFRLPLVTLFFQHWQVPLLPLALFSQHWQVPLLPCELFVPESRSRFFLLILQTGAVGGVQGIKRDQQKSVHTFYKYGSSSSSTNPKNPKIPYRS